jgi:hypothetical protein
MAIRPLRWERISRQSQRRGCSSQTGVSLPTVSLPTVDLPGRLCCTQVSNCTCLKSDPRNRPVRSRAVPTVFDCGHATLLRAATACERYMHCTTQCPHVRALYLKTCLQRKNELCSEYGQCFKHKNVNCVKFVPPVRWPPQWQCPHPVPQDGSVPGACTSACCDNCLRRSRIEND